MFRKVLVPVDFTDANLHALDVAADIAKPAGGLIELLHVVQTIPGLSGDEEREFYRRLEESAKKRLGEFGRRLELRSARFNASVTLGSRVGEILRVATEQQVDVIVLSSHRVDLDDRAKGWGTLSYQVALLAPCAVLLVK